MKYLNKKDNEVNPASNETYSGRQLYNAKFISGLNRKPVENLKTHVKASYLSDEIELPISLDTVLEALLVDGSLVIVSGAILTGTILAISDYEAVIEQDDFYIHVFKAGNTASISYHKEFEADTGLLGDSTGEALEVPAEEVVIFPNAKGILYHPQKTLLRLEEIYEQLKKTSAHDSILFVKGGSISSDALNNRIQFELKADRPVVRLASNEDITQPNFAPLANRLFTELKQLEAAWAEATANLYVFPNESGVARRYALQPFISKVGELKQQCKEIYAEMGFEIEFDEFDLTGTAEDRAEVELVMLAQSNGYITKEEAAEKVRRIFGLEQPMKEKEDAGITGIELNESML